MNHTSNPKLDNLNRLSLKEQLEKKIYSYIKTLWLNKVDSITLKEWQSNFSSCSEEEIINMLYLLSKFSYFGEKEIRMLLKTIYRDFIKYPIIQKIRQNNQDTIELVKINTIFDLELEKTRFIGVGNPSESGVHLLYYFRQENGLSKEHFLNTGDIFTNTVRKEINPDDNSERQYLEGTLKNDNIKRYVFIDDLCGSGTQVKDYLLDIVENIRFADKEGDIEIEYIMLIGLEEGIKNVKDLGVFNKVEAVFHIDKTFKCFSDESRYYTSPPDTIISKEDALKLSHKFGQSQFLHSLGYKDGQLLIGLFHNTPDNTLPIFWGEKNNWRPIFKRFHKIY